MRRSVASCAVVLLAAAGLSACGGGGSSKAGNILTTTTASGGSPSSSELSKLVANAGKQKIKITYDNGGITQTYAQDGQGDTMQGDSSSETFTTKTATIACDKGAGSFTCTESPGSSGDDANGFLSLASTEQPIISLLKEGFGSTSTKTIAGRVAQCVTLSAKDIAANGGPKAVAEAALLKGSATYCIDEDTGATLEVSSTDNSGKASTSFLVTKFAQPTASDFVPPATPSTLPANITIPGGN